MPPKPEKAPVWPAVEIATGGQCLAVNWQAIGRRDAKPGQRLARNCAGWDWAWVSSGVSVECWVVAGDIAGGIAVFAGVLIWVDGVWRHSAMWGKVCAIAGIVADIADFVAGIVAGGWAFVVGVAGIGGWWQAGGVAGDIAVFAGDIAGGIAGFRFAVFAGILILDGAARLA